MSPTHPPDASRITVARDGAIATITLNAPELMNRIDGEVHHQLTEALRALGDDDAGLRAVVLASTGKVFSAGGDFDLMLAGNADLAVRRQMTREGGILFSALLDVPVPVVAAVQGDAIGLGATIALACDVVVTHPTCRFADPHVNIGLVAGDGGAIVWPSAVGMMRAKWHLLTGEPLRGDEAHAMGLVTQLAEGPDQVEATAREIAERLAALPPIAVQGTKQTLNQVLRARMNEALSLGLAHELTSLGSEDLAEAVDAFKSKRPPRYRGL
jgi:enoyl-CoA hydratase